LAARRRKSDLKIYTIQKPENIVYLQISLKETVKAEASSGVKISTTGKR
jgi:hypothetical protein